MDVQADRRSVGAIQMAMMEIAKKPLARSERRPVNLPGHAILENGSTASVTLLDLSYDGCAIDCGVELRPGEAIKLSVQRLGVIEAQVRWYSQGKAGLVFDTTISERETICPRKSERVSLSADVSLRRHGKLSYQVRVLDASPDGCKVEFVDRPQIHDQIWIKFNALDSLEAQVCWIDGSTAGLQYTRPIHPAVFDLLVQRVL